MVRAGLACAGLALLLAAGCAAPGPGGGCGPRDVALRNASALAVEQAYGGSGASGGWGAELLGPAELPPGASRSIRLPAGAQAVRLVWVNGRAAELGGIDPCAISGLTLTDTTLRAER
jgi:hypothetical protein